MQKISQSKTIILPINKLGKNYLPYIKDLEVHKIKYIDIHRSLILNENDELVYSFSTGFYLSIADRFGTIVSDNISTAFFQPTAMLGERVLIDKHISLQNSYVFNSITPVEAGIGQFVTITFYWDEDKFSSYNFNKKTYKETVELLLSPSTSIQRVEKIKFPDIRTFANKRIRSIRPAWKECSVSPLGYQSINNGTEEPSSIEYSIYLTLANGNYKLIDHLDLSLLKDTGFIDSISFNDLLVNFPDSYIEVYIDYASVNNLPTEVRSIPMIIEYVED